MPFDPTTFGNLTVVGSGSTIIDLTMGGDAVWFAPTHDCAVWTDPGHILGSTTCPGWDHIPDVDAVDLSGVAALTADFVTLRIAPGSAVATFDVGSGGGEFPACKIEADGGGCNYRDPLNAVMLWEDGAGSTLSGVEDDGTPTGSGPWEVDGLPVFEGPDRLVNPHPPTYFGIDPTNSANEILWRPDDISPLRWVWAPPGFEGNEAGAAHDLEVTVGYTLWQYITPPPPVGFMCVL